MPEFTIVGQGLAGTAAGLGTPARGRNVLVVDSDRGGASRLAAGLITPVTGKRLAKSWRWDELYPAACAFYRTIEAETGASFFHQRPAVRLFANEAERVEFNRRVDTMLCDLVDPRLSINEEWFVSPFGGLTMPHAARLDVVRYLDASTRKAFPRLAGHSRPRNLIRTSHSRGKPSSSAVASRRKPTQQLAPSS